MSTDEINVLEEIVELDGSCLQASRCAICPFKKKCLGSFLDDKDFYSKRKRFNLALSNLASITLLDEH